MSQPKDVVKQIRKATRRKFSAEDKIRIVLEGLRGEISISELCRREGIAASIYYKWSKAFLAAGKNGRHQRSSWYWGLLVSGRAVWLSSWRKIWAVR